MATLKLFHKVIIRDSSHMAEMPDDSVHLAVTSPPYGQLME